MSDPNLVNCADCDGLFEEWELDDEDLCDDCAYDAASFEEITEDGE